MLSRILLSHSVQEINNGSNGFIKLLSTSTVSHSNVFEKSLTIKDATRIGFEESTSSKEEVEYAKALKNKIIVSENENVGLVSGIPEEHIKTRLARIYQPAKSAMQSGTNNVQFWQIDFETRERWENPLMGWTSSGDPLSNVKVDFSSKEEAIDHCKKMGWQFYIQNPNKSAPKPRSYGVNFSWNKRTRVSTK